MPEMYALCTNATARAFGPHERAYVQRHECAYVQRHACAAPKLVPSAGAAQHHKRAGVGLGTPRPGRARGVKINFGAQMGWGRAYFAPFLKMAAP